MNNTLTTITENAGAVTSMNYAVMTVNETVVASQSARLAIKRLETAFNLAECAELAKALAIAELRILCVSREITEFPNIVELCKSVFGISKAQTYNYLQVADWITYRYESLGTKYNEESGEEESCLYVLTEKEYNEADVFVKSAYKKRYTDYFTNYNGKPFSVTALLAIIRFIKLDKNGDMDESARARYNFVIQSVKEGKISGEMSVNQLSNWLDGNKPTTKKVTVKDNKPTDNKPTDNKPTDNKPTDNKPTDNKPTDNKPTDNKPIEEQLVFNRSEIEEIKDTLTTCIEMLCEKKIDKGDISNKITTCLAILKGIDFKNAVKAVEGE